MSKTALVVDDSKSARFAIRKFLEGFNYKVDTAESAYDAYKQLAYALPEVIFLDHIMPGVDGFEALRVIKSDPLTAAVPVVICSSNEGEDFVRQAKARGASDVLQKPPSPEQFAGVLANLVNHSTGYKATLQQAETEYVLARSLLPMPLLTMPKTREPPAMERLMSDTPPKVIPPAQVLTSIPPPNEVVATISAVLIPAPANKLASVSESAGAIQQRVLPTLAATPPLSVPSRGENTIGDGDALRTELEVRLKEISQDLFAEVGSLRAQLATLGAGPSLDSEEKLRAFALGAARARTHALAQSVEQHLTALRNSIDVVLRAQNQRLDQVAQIAREAAEAECERTMMKIAQRISDQMTESILKTLEPRLAKLSGGNQS